MARIALGLICLALLLGAPGLRLDGDLSRFPAGCRG